MPRWNRARSVSRQRRPRIHKGRFPSWIGMNPQPRSGDLSVVGPWIGDDSQPHSGDLSVGSMAKIIKFIVARTSKWLG
jgi:hypothetical protein